jgi:hypothetical protein
MNPDMIREASDLLFRKRDLSHAISAIEGGKNIRYFSCVIEGASEISFGRAANREHTEMRRGKDGFLAGELAKTWMLAFLKAELIFVEAKLAALGVDEAA